MLIHETGFTYALMPSVMGLLNSHIFFWFVVLVTVGVVVFLAAKLWHLHSIPKYQSKGMSQAKLVFWMTLLGLFFKPLWIFAVACIVIDWTALQNWIRGTK
jgi:hypothetical protein